MAYLYAPVNPLVELKWHKCARREYIQYVARIYGAINNKKLLLLPHFRLVTVTSIYIFSVEDFNIIL